MPTHRRRAAPAVVAIAVAAVAVLGVLWLVVRGGDDDAVAPTASGSPGASDSATASSAAPGEAAPIFGPAPEAAADLPPDISLGAVTRSRYVTFDAAVLPSSPDGTLLALDFFDDASFVGRVEQVDRQQVFTSWSGPVVGLAKSIFVITQTGDRYQVTASTTRGSFTMNLTASGFYQAAEVQQPDVLDEGGVTAGATAARP